MRPISDLVMDAAKAASAGADHMLINRAELRQLKEYQLVEGTENPDIAHFAPMVSVLVDGEKIHAPTSLQLHVREVLP